MRKSKTYYWVKFTPTVIINALDEFKKIFSSKEEKEVISYMYSIRTKDESWDYDTESEFFAEYRSEIEYAIFSIHFRFNNIFKLETYLYKREPSTDISIQLTKKSDIEAVFEVFENAVSSCQIPKPAPPAPLPEPPWESKVKIFIGHGKSHLWHELKEHLSDKHGFTVEAYEFGSNAGLAIKDILQEMATKSSIAFLVFTAETQDIDGNLHPRENVIHELGLFQGSLGWERGIILLEDGVTEFSNITGTQQIRFSKNSIRETFGEVLATIRREFCP